MIALTERSPAYDIPEGCQVARTHTRMLMTLLSPGTLGIVQSSPQTAQPAQRKPTMHLQDYGHEDGWSPEQAAAMLVPGLAGPAAGTWTLAARPSLHAGPASAPAGPRAGQLGQQPGACGSPVAWTAAAQQIFVLCQPVANLQNKPNKSRLFPLACNCHPCAKCLVAECMQVIKFFHLALLYDGLQM